MPHISGEALVVSGNGQDLADELLLRQVGGKAASLWRLQSLKLCVPPFYVVTSTACDLVRSGSREWQQLEDTVSRAWSVDPGRAAADAEALFQAIGDATLPETLLRQMESAHQALALSGKSLAVRSSLADEDGSLHSFAGIHTTVLGVNEFALLPAAVKSVWQSAWGATALAYRRYHGLPVRSLRIAVIVQELIDATFSGVVFSRHPVTGAECIVINYVPGLADALVSADSSCHSCLIDRLTGVRSVEWGVMIQRRRFDRSRGQIVTESISSESAMAQTLSEAQLEQLARVVVSVEQQSGAQQDVEFCIDEQGVLHLLQSRPLTGMAAPLPPSRGYVPGPAGAEGQRMSWDNSNIIESYRGVTSPMTFSFIRRAYSIVYRCFLEVMGVSSRQILAHHRTSERMLGLVRGRVYYNLHSWYTLLRLFPGFDYNRSFMESMMGVRESFRLENAPAEPGRLRRWFVELPALLRLVLRSAWNFLRIDSLVRRFQSRFESRYREWRGISFRDLSPHDWMRTYERMEDALLWNWHAPIVVDFYVMVFHGLLRKLAVTWCRDSSGAIVNELLTGEGGIESVEPARRLLNLSAEACRDRRLRQALLEGPVETLPERLAADGRFEPFLGSVSRYLDDYGFRCADELKLEEPSLQEQPWRLFSMIRSYAALDRPDVLDSVAMERREQQIRGEAERRARAALHQRGGTWWRRPVFDTVLSCTRRGIRHRENLRFARTRIYGLFRSMLNGLGGQFQQAGVLSQADDIYYLTVEEIADFVYGRAVTVDLAQLTLLRRREYDTWRREGRDPMSRFGTQGPPSLDPAWHQSESPADQVSGLLRGIGCCQGIVTARV